MTEDVILKEFEKLRKRIMESKLVEDATAVEIGALFEISNIINRQKSTIKRQVEAIQAGYKLAEELKAEIKEFKTLCDMQDKNMLEQKVAIEKLKIAYETLKQEYDSMFSANRNLMAEVEILTGERDYLAKKEHDNLYEQIQKIKKAKAEAYKEFAERLKKEAVVCGDGEIVFDFTIDNLAKEMTERKDECNENK